MNDPTIGKPIEILLVEDNPGDVRLTAEVLKEQKVMNRLHTVSDGVEAMKFLRREGDYADAPRPGLVLLDLNLPRMDGRDVLTEMKRDDVLREIPVVILTSSQSEEDVLRSYGLRANSYATKPVDVEQLMNVVRTIKEFALVLIAMPEENNARAIVGEQRPISDSNNP